MFHPNTGNHILRRTRTDLLTRFVAFGATMGVVSVGLTTKAMATGESVYYMVVLACVVAVIAVALDALDMLLAISADIADPTSAALTGRVLLPATVRAVDLFSAQATVTLDDETFHISREDAARLGTGEYHRVYYAPHSRIILAVDA